MEHSNSWIARLLPRGVRYKGRIHEQPVASTPTAANLQRVRLPLVIGQGPGGASYSVPIQTLLFFTALGFLPAVLLMMTGFTRIVIVLSLMRQALGTQAAPPNQVIVGLSLFLTFFVMSPVLDKIYTEAYLPFSENKITLEQAYDKGSAPLKTFMLKQTRETDLALFVKISGGGEIQSFDQVPMKILIPAYVTSELKTAFQIGFLIFLPFIVIDLVVATVLMSLGMAMLSPSISRTRTLSRSTICGSSTAGWTIRCRWARLAAPCASN